MSSRSEVQPLGPVQERSSGSTPPETVVLMEPSAAVLQLAGITVSSTAVSTGGSGGEDRLTENVTLNFREVNVKYKAQKEDGSAGPAKEFGWNIAENVQL